MVSTKTLIIIGAGIAIAAGLAYVQYQFMSQDTHGSQLARSRLGLDKAPRTGVDRLLGEVEELLYNKTGERVDLTPRSNAAYYYSRNLAAEEEQYEPWALLS
jgi:hypothetical protein